ncbi:MAG: hypothetical protein EZS28_045346, partial [Streblomastix strix]
MAKPYNLIAVSYKCIVFVLLWDPSKPKITSSTSPKGLNEHQQQIQQHPASIRTISTLCFPSPVKSLAASTICTRSFLIVGCESPPAIFLFRMDSIHVAQETEQARKQLWDEGEQLLDRMKYQIVYPSVQRPDLSLIIQNGVKSDPNINDYYKSRNIRLGESNECKIIIADSSESQSDGLKSQELTSKQLRFIEVQSGSHQFVEVQYSSSASMTRLLDLYPYDNPQQILLTTFGRKVRIYTKEEIDVINSHNPINHEHQIQEHISHKQSKDNENQKQGIYLQNEGVVLLVT